MKKYKVIFDMGFYNKEFIVEAENEKDAVLIADYRYEKQMGYMMFYYSSKVIELKGE